VASAGGLNASDQQPSQVRLDLSDNAPSDAVLAAKPLQHDSDLLFGQRTAIQEDRLKPTAIFRRDVYDNPCSHIESLNCFGQFGHRL
jgi:hypothetical protein